MGKNTWSKSRWVIDIRYISPVLVLTLKKGSTHLRCILLLWQGYKDSDAGKACPA